MRKKIGTVLLFLTIMTASACSAAQSPALSWAGSQTTASAAAGSGTEPGTAEDPADSASEQGESSTDTVIEVTGSTKPVPEPTDTVTTPDETTSSDEVTSSDDEPSEEPPAEDPEEPGEEEPADPKQEEPAEGDEGNQGAGEPGDPGSDEPPEEVPAGEAGAIPSNLPPELKQQLDDPRNGMLLIYHPERYEEIKAITRWTVAAFETETELLVVTKARGSIVEIAVAELSGDEGVVLPGEVIRNWETTSDYEVIRVHYTDAESIPLHFIRVRQPDGQVTIAPLKTSGKEDYDLLAFPYED